MAKYTPETIRNVAILGHSHDGKTTLAEALLLAAGAIPRMGSTETGSATLDFEPEEHKHNISIGAGIGHLEHNGVKVNLIDAPGFADFAGEAIAALRAAEAAMVVVGASSGVAVGTEAAWEMLAERGEPRLVVINKMDKEHADFKGTLKALQDSFEPKPVPLHLPIGSEAGFKGVVDLLHRKAYLYDGGQVTAGDIPEEMLGEVDTYRTQLVEAACMADDTLLEHYLDGQEIADDEIVRATHEGIRSGQVIPVLCAAATTGVGARQILDAIVELMPSAAEVPAAEAEEHEGLPPDPDGPVVALCFKTTADPFVGRINYLKVVSGTLKPDQTLQNTTRGQAERLAALTSPLGKTLQPVTELVAGDIGSVSKLAATRTGDTLCAKEKQVTLPPPKLPTLTYQMAVSAKTKGEEEKVFSGIHKLLDEDPTLELTREETTKEQILRGLGDVHLDVALEKLKRKYGVEAELKLPRVPYRETITGTARVDKKHKKQSGGAGMYGHAVIEVEPAERDAGLVWEDKIFGGAIPQNFRPSVEKGVRKAMEDGVLVGSPVVDVHVRLVDGSTHSVDGKDIAFQIAGAMAMREAVREANPVLLEPIMEVSVTVPEQFMGDVMSLLSGKRGKIGGTEMLPGKKAQIKGQVPLKEMYEFPKELRSMTQGRGTYTMEFSRYEEVPAHVAQALVDAYQKANEGKVAAEV
ncbi:MAG TPA: elongation factor G [Candidatus Dormibacteraeota bacterium]|jgi:elongation factor G|nr:elongation factor G [Candidatus Dormibacteraeota bacterium]